MFWGGYRVWVNCWDYMLTDVWPIHSTFFVVLVVLKTKEAISEIHDRPSGGDCPHRHRKTALKQHRSLPPGRGEHNSARQDTAASQTLLGHTRISSGELHAGLPSRQETDVQARARPIADKKRKKHTDNYETIKQNKKQQNGRAPIQVGTAASTRGARNARARPGREGPEQAETTGSYCLPSKSYHGSKRKDTRQNAHPASPGRRRQHQP